MSNHLHLVKEPGLDLGIWFDDPLHAVTPRYIETLKSVGIERVHIMLDRSIKGWNPRFDREHCEQIKYLFKDFRIILVIWPEPTKGYMNDMKRDLPNMIKDTGAEGVEFDLEHNWKRKLTRGYDSFEEAGLDLVASVDECVSGPPLSSLDLYVTTFPAHAEALEHAVVTPHVDYLNLQVYSVRQRDQNPQSWQGALDPGTFQSRALTKAADVLESQGCGVELVAGLALWDQKWERRRPEEAIEAAWNSTLVEGCNRMTFWSSKFLAGVRKNDYSLRALRGLLAE